MEMNYCMRCGARLTEREHPTDGMVLWCGRCEDYRFPMFSTAVAVAVYNPEKTKLLLIRQYGDPHDVLPAGYVDKGERPEEAVCRELMEELGLEAHEPRYLCSRYYAPSETLMLCYAVTVEEKEARPNFEVDSWRWVRLDEAREDVRPGGLAERLLRDIE